MEGWVGLGTTTASKQSAQDTWRLSQLLATQAVTPHWSAGERRTYDLFGRKLRR